MGFPVFLPEDEWLYRQALLSLFSPAAAECCRLQKSVPYGFMVHAAPFQGKLHVN